MPQCIRMFSSRNVVPLGAFLFKCDAAQTSLSPLQQFVSTPVKMEGPAQLLTLAPVLWGGLGCSVKQVGKRVSRNKSIDLIKVGWVQVFVSLRLEIMLHIDS